MTKLLLTLTMSLGVSLAACGSGDEMTNGEDLGEDLGEDYGNSTLTIENQSSYAFIEINLSPVSASSWGADILGNDILSPGQAVEISGIECDDYDARIVDDEGDECIVEAVDLCFDDQSWVIDDDTLALCVAF